jgi:hypothetical protein
LAQIKTITKQFYFGQMSRNGKSTEQELDWASYRTYPFSLSRNPIPNKVLALFILPSNDGYIVRYLFHRKPPFESAG